MPSLTESEITFQDDVQAIIRQELQKFKDELLADLKKLQPKEADVTVAATKSVDTSLGFTEGLMIGGLIAWFTFRSWK